MIWAVLSVLLLVATVSAQDLYCSFDVDQCGFKNERTPLVDNFDWTWTTLERKYSTVSIRGKGNSGRFWSGNYGGGFASDGIVARLNSPPLKNIGCVQFYYYRSEGLPGSFDVFLHDVGSSDKDLKLVWGVSEGDDSGWQFASIPIKTAVNKSVELIFMSQYFIAQTGIIAAIDDVNITTGSCSLQPPNMKDRVFTEDKGSCTFDKTMCGYKPENSTWKRDRRKYWNAARDHTTKYGAYVYSEGMTNRLVSPIINSAKCLTFFYYMFLDGNGTLNVYKRINGKDKRIFQLTGNENKLWQKATVPLKSPNKNFQIVFETIRGRKGSRRDIAIDDVSTYSTCELKDYSCSFDQKTCGFYKTVSDEWKHVNKKTYAGGIDVKDHTTGRGMFMSAEKTYKAISRLSSPAFPKAQCIQFYYYRTESRGSLDVLISVGRSKNQLVWTTEDSTLGWIFASIPVNINTNNSITVIFQVDFYNFQGGPNPNIFGLLDDFKVTQNTSCPYVPDQPKSRIFKEVQGSCHFENSMCGYNKNKPGVWRRKSGTTMTMFTGPSFDHTTKTNKGFYIFAEASGIKTGTKSHFTSPVLNYVRCATFYYHMYGDHIGELNVYERVKGVDTSLFSLTGNQGSLWHKATILLLNHKGNESFQLVFESVRGKGYKGDIAIDDISTDSECILPPTTSGPPTGALRTSTTQVPVPTVRLANGPSKYEGRVEISYNGKWGTICDDVWTIENAQVVCRMLGFPGELKAVKGAQYGSSGGTVWLDDVTCKGNENSIAQCRHAGWGANSCTYNKDAGVICQPDTKTPTNGTCTFDINLCGYTNGDRSVSEVDFIRNRGSTPSSFTGPSSDVSGNGYYMYLETSSGRTGIRAKLFSPNITSSTVKCVSFFYHMRGSDIGSLNVYVKTGNKLLKYWSLSGHQKKRWLQGSLPLDGVTAPKFQLVFEAVRGNDYQGDVAIDSIQTYSTKCGLVPPKAKYVPDLNAMEGDVRLVGDPSGLKGRVEIFHQSQWGTICNSLWDNTDADVVCRQLGYYSGRLTSLSPYGQGKGPVWLQNVQCNGKEQRLDQCQKSKWGQHSCSHSQDAAVKCNNGTNSECKDYKVLDNADRSVYHMVKGNKCDKNGGIFPGEWHRFQGAAGKTMSETCIPTNRCGTHAPGWLDGNLKLLKGNKRDSGVVQIQYRQTAWGKICHKKQSSALNVANVVCRSLGYRRAKDVGAYSGSGSDGRFVLSGIVCRGDEPSLAFCLHNGWGNAGDCTEGMSVTCTSEKLPEPVTPCSVKPCKNNGQCELAGSSYTCKCPRLYIGRQCETNIGSGVVGLLLSGSVDKFDPDKFKNSIADILNKHCDDCDTSVRKKRASDKMTKDNVIILEDPRTSTRSPPGYVYIEFVVVKTQNGQLVAINPDKVSQAVSKSNADVGGYKIVASSEPGNTKTPPKVAAPSARAQTGEKDKKDSSLGMTIAFAVVLTVLLSVIIVVTVICFMQRRKKPASGQTYILRSVNRTKDDEHKDNDVLITDDDVHLL